MYRLISIIFICLFSLPANRATARDIHLTLPVIRELPQAHIYYRDLLTQALAAIGHTAVIKTVNIPHLRAKEYLRTGRISLIWMLSSKARNAQFDSVGVDLTGGLAGMRLLLIPNGTQRKFDSVLDLDSFRSSNLVGAFGRDWFDTKVWEANQLPYYVQDGNWQVIFDRLPQSRMDYFSRSILEIVQEESTHPHLSIEKNLVFQYDRDFRFYLSEDTALLKPILETALLKATQSGLIQKLVHQYWSATFKKTNFHTRRRIRLKTPH